MLFHQQIAIKNEKSVKKHFFIKKNKAFVKNADKKK
jgi:hypothetical protein